MRVDPDDRWARLRGEAVVDERGAVEDRAGQHTQTCREAFGRFEHGMEERLAYELLSAVRKNLIVHPSPAQLGWETTGKLGHLVERGGDMCPGDPASVVDLQPDEGERLGQAVAQAIEACGVFHVAAWFHRIGYEQ